MGHYEVGKKQIIRFYNFLIKFYIVLVTGTMIIELQKGENLDQGVKNGFTIVNFVMNGCSFCKKLGKVLDILDYEIPSLKIIKVSKERNSKEIESRSLEAFPTVYFYKDGQKVDEMVGFNPIEEFYPIIKKYLY